MIFNSRLAPSTYTVKDASDISVIVILKHFDKFRASLPYRSKLKLQCHTVLVEDHVKAGCAINLSKSKLASAYGITDIVILRCKLNSSSSANIEDPCRISHKTNINIESVQSADYFHLSSDQHPVQLGGLDHELHQLKTLLDFSKIHELPPTQRNVGVLLHGPPGCGKTSLGKALSYSSCAALLNVEATDILKAEFGAGSEALSKIFFRAISLSAEGPVILFLDDLDTLCPQLTSASLGNRQLTSALITELDKLHDNCVPGLLVVAATNAISCINPALRRPGRFDREILVNIPSQQQRLLILSVHTGTMRLDTEVSLEDLAKMTTGYVGADVQALCQEALNQAFNRRALSGGANMDSLFVKMCDFTAALHKVGPSLKKGLSCHMDLQPVLWDDIGGLNDIKAEIQQSIEWPLMHPEALRRMDLGATKGVLLYGPPGCCKTTLVRAAATSCHVTFLSLSGAQVYSPYVGESERIISEAFQKARALSPCILFFDEIDSLVGKRSSGGSQSRVQERILSTLLNEMDGIGTRLDMKTHALREGGEEMERESTGSSGEDLQAQASCSTNAGFQKGDGNTKLSDIDMSRVIVIGATNRPDMLDPAILRPGRLDRHIYVPPPDAEGRKSILNIQVSKMATADLDQDYIGERTEFFSGADLKNLCREAALTAVRESSAQGTLDANSLVVRQHHFITALKTVKPSLSQTALQQYSPKHKIL